MKPLDGLNVLDLSWVVAGPVVTRALADFGATVVRVESSTRVETARFMPPFANGEFSTESSILYATWNAGKLGMTVNLQDERGQQIIRDLVKWADVVLEAFSPGLLARWGLDYATLSADRPDLIMVSSAINGQTGPVAKLAGYGNVGAALSGFQEIVGQKHLAPLGPYGPYTDFVAPRLALPTLLAAIDHRARTGEGSYIDLSQVEAGVYFQAPELAAHFAEGFVAERMGNDDREHAPNGAYRTRDEQDGARTVTRYVAISVTEDAQWPRLAEWMGRADLAADPALATAEGRLAQRRTLDEALMAATAGRLAHEVEAELQALGIPAHVSANSRDFCTDPQLAHRGHLVTLAHPDFGSVTVEGPRYRLSDTPGGPEAVAPHFGRDNAKVLREFAGYDDAKIAALEADGVLK